MPSSNILAPVFGSLFSSVVPADRAFDADTLAWEAQVIVNGGTVSLARRIIVDQFIFDLKSAGAWALTDDYWAFWAENTAQALTSLKQRRLATAVNAPTFTADRDYAFDGATQYIDTGFVSNISAVAMTGTNLRLSVYERTNVGTTTFAAGAYNSSTRNIVIVPRSAGGGLIGRLNSDQIQAGSTFVDSRGMSVVQRSGSSYGVYKNGTPYAITGPTIEGVDLTGQPLGIGAYIVSGAGSGHRAASIGFASIGAAMSDAQNLAAYNATQAFATAVGAQV